jgi:hypothetical protein
MNTSTTDGSARTERPPRRLAAVAAAIGFVVLAGFQLALASGAPLGRAAWGGTYERLPTSLRIASALAVAVWALAALIVLRRGGLRISALPPAMARLGTWILVGLLSLGVIANVASRSNWERFLWGPVALILAVLCLVVGRGGEADARGSSRRG